MCEKPEKKAYQGEITSLKEIIRMKDEKNKRIRKLFKKGKQTIT